jgi:hypothetical protein
MDTPRLGAERSAAASELVETSFDGCDSHREEMQGHGMPLILP